jgi:hypothetical protein
MKKLLPYLTLFVLLPIGCAVLFGAINIYWPGSTRWRDMPPLETSASSIVAAGLQEVVVEDAEGRLYLCDSRRDGPCWQEISTVPVFSEDELCGFAPTEPPPAPAGTVQRLDVHLCYAEATFSTSYALDESGQLKSWEADTTAYGTLIGFFFWPLAGCAAGVLVAGCGSLFVYLKQRKNNR